MNMKDELFNLISFQRNENQWDTTTYPPNWLNFKTLREQGEYEDVEHLTLSYTAGEEINWYNYFEKLSDGTVPTEGEY